MPPPTLVLLLGLLAGTAGQKICGWADVGSSDDYSGLSTAGCSELHLEHKAGSDKQMGDLGALKLARVLMSNTQLVKLVLVGQNIGPAGAAELAEMLKTNKAITSVDLIDNQIEKAGAAVLAEALQENYVLQSLLANVDDDGAAVLVDAITCNQRFVNTPEAARKQEATACKTGLNSFLERSAGAIQQAVQAQAQLEVRLHQEAQRREISKQPGAPANEPAASPPADAAATPCVDSVADCASWAQEHQCEKNPSYMGKHCRKSCNLCPTTPPPASTPPPYTPPAVTHPPAANPLPPSFSAPPASTPPASTPPASTPAHTPAHLAEGLGLQSWLQKHGLTVAAHMPLLQALGVRRIDGRVGGLWPLRKLSFAELSAELAPFAPELPCSPRCAADKAALYAALQESVDQK